MDSQFNFQCQSVKYCLCVFQPIKKNDYKKNKL